MDKLRRRMCSGAIIGAIGMMASVGAVAGEHLPKPVRHDVFACTQRTCAVPTSGAYPYLIIGRFKQAADTAQSQNLFKAMRAHHHWQHLPDSAKKFHVALQPVAIRLADGSMLVALMTQDEMHAARPQPGDLVRYSPHRGKYEIPPADPAARAYWSVDGCVAVLCRVGDKTCYRRYHTGVYRPVDGVAISARNFHPLPHHVAINPDTLLPVSVSDK